MFIAAGAFHISKVQDLIPELQGRFPILVELNSLSKQDFIDILTIPKNAITIQYATLLKVDGVDLKFTDDAIGEIARIAEEMNLTSEDIGARRLHTVMENLLEEVSFEADGTIKERFAHTARGTPMLCPPPRTKDTVGFFILEIISDIASPASTSPPTVLRIISIPSIFSFSSIDTS